MTDATGKAKEHKRLTLQLGAIALGAFAFGFALIPLYDVLCDLTGFGNQKALAEVREANQTPDDSRSITIDFIADLQLLGSLLKFAEWD